MSDNETRVKVWITKYALTRGIFEMEGVLIDDGKYVSDRHSRIFTSEYALSAAEAAVTARAMKAAKIASLKKQIARITKLVF